MDAISTVLVVDDDEGVRKTMERLLRAYGYYAATAATVDEALALLGATTIQAVILDVGLESGLHSDETGLELLATIRGRREFDDAPVLIFTGRGLSDEQKATIRRHGAFLFQKPEGFHSLVNFLDTLTGRDQPH
jgi:DNA-binding response OmpR family regulator